MTQFDTLLAEYNKSRTIKRTERYPRDITLTRDFLEVLEREYFNQYVAGNRNFHSNFMKALSFELDRFKNNKELEAKYADLSVASDVPVFDLDAEIPEG